MALSIIFQIYDLLASLIDKASTDRYGEGKAEARNLNMENSLPTNNQTNAKAVQNEKSQAFARDFKFICAGGDSPSGRFVDPKRLQAGLAVFAFRRKESLSAQTKTSLRLSPPHTRKAVCVFPA